MPTLYWSDNNTADQSFDNVNNWWLDDAASIPASVVPWQGGPYDAYDLVLSSGSLDTTANINGSYNSGTGTCSIIISAMNGTIGSGTWTSPMNGSIGTINGGVFSGAMSGTLYFYGGTFTGGVEVGFNGYIAGGEFNCYVISNTGEPIGSGTFTVSLDTSDTIEGGTFSGSVYGGGTIMGGIFSGSVSGMTIIGGTYEASGTFRLGSLITPGTYNLNVVDAPNSDPGFAAGGGTYNVTWTIADLIISDILGTGLF